MNPFLKPSADRRRLPIRAEATPQPNGKAAVMRLYDPLDSWGGEWGISAKEFTTALDGLGDVTEITVLINSPGGEVWEGLAILNALRAHPATVTAVVEGIAASAASFIAAGVDRLVMARNSEMFVHKAWGMAVGNSDDMAKAARDLDREDRNIAAIYASKAGGEIDAWLAVMAADTWYSADEAVACGLADSIAPAKGGGAVEARNRFDLSPFNRASARESLPAADGLSTPLPPAAPEDTIQEGDVMSDALKTALAHRLGVTAPVDELDDSKLLAALDEALSEQEAPAPTPVEVPEGTVVVDQAAFEQLQADAEAGRAAKDELDKQRREGVVENAIKAGKVKPADREAWVNRISAPGAEKVITEVINSLTPAFPVVEHGFTGGTESHNDDEASLVQAAGWEN